MKMGENGEIWAPDWRYILSKRMFKAEVIFAELVCQCLCVIFIVMTENRVLVLTETIVAFVEMLSPDAVRSLASLPQR